MKATINFQFSLERFNGNNNFTLWQRRVNDILVQQGLAKALKGKDAKQETMEDDDWEELVMKFVSTIRLFVLAKDGGRLEPHGAHDVFNGCLDQLRKVDDGESAAREVQSRNRGKKSDDRLGGSNGSNSSSRGNGVQCYYCKEFGHVKRDCPLRKDKGKKCDDASSCNSLVVANDGDCLTVSEGINTSSHDEWTLDSGCTMHVCSKNEFFDTFQERDDGSLLLDDVTPSKIQGVGNVKIKMFDGVVCTLGGVVYIPKLQRNLISLSRMDSNGRKYFVGGGAMKITRSGKVLMKGEKCEGL
ncbi:hypothetical protein Acr_06g0011780 [Actinidia rufa]|uniref:CCHC-type domain-containing protein n=1 Tax=Actinidia rufa TaxID=165716 RepID=A0A7J0ERY4_9ERIC|nr:hypothetical protein Acr_06g0011780 [Actinidia rufa]